MLNEINRDDLENMVSDLVGDMVPDCVEDTVSNILPEMVHSILSEGLANCELVLKDGSILRSKPMMRIMSPDHSMAVQCFGGLRVKEVFHLGFDDKNNMQQMLSELFAKGLNRKDFKGKWALEIQTWVSSWEEIATYETREEAVAILQQVNQAMLSGAEFFQI